MSNFKNSIIMKTTYLFFVVLFLIALTASNSWSQGNKTVDTRTFSNETPYIDCIGEGPFLVEGTSTTINKASKFEARLHATITNLVTDEVYYFDVIYNDNWNWEKEQGAHGENLVLNFSLTDSNGNVLASGQTHNKWGFNANWDFVVNFYKQQEFPCEIPTN